MQLAGFASFALAVLKSDISSSRSRIPNRRSQHGIIIQPIHAEQRTPAHDGKAARSKNAVVKGTYDRLRGMAKKHVESAIPRLGKLIEKHAS